jgi:ABC-type lipoprotein export system ATPase subunit
LEARDLTLSWGSGHLVTREISLAVDAGEILVLVGRSGCGKTTILHALAGLTQPLSGQVLLRGEDVTGKPGRVSYMLQKDLLLPSKRIIDNVCLPLVIKGMRRNEAREKAAPLFERFGLAGTEAQWPSQLSGGMRQRVAFLRTYLMGNDVVLLDNVADAKIISQTAQQLQLLEQRGYGDEAICRLLGVPKVMAMIGEGGSYKMPEHATQEFMLRTIQPRIREAEDEFNSKLLSFDDFGKRRIHVCELALRRLDAKGQADIDKLHLEAGWSVNELRAQYDLPSIPEGDAHYVSTNLAEVGSEKLRSNGGGRPTEKPAEE